MRVLLLSGYAARSHVRWQHSLQEMLPDWQWRVLSLPPRHFSWRIRGNPLYWSLEERTVLEEQRDLLVATSMVDLATLRGLVPTLAGLPSLLYFHENQFAYPAGRQRHSPVEAQMVSLYAALAADRLAFNSAWNRDSFLAGCDALLTRLPDRVPAGIVPGLAGKSCLLPVPVESPARSPGPAPGTPEKSAAATRARPEAASSRSGSGGWQGWPGRPGGGSPPLRLLWVGRFEHDKGGDGLLQTLRCLTPLQVNFQLAVVGQQFRDSPAVFAEIAREFAPRLVQFGYLPSRDALYRCMEGADLVFSTAGHEFQGLAVLEAVARGCRPVVPDRLAYPEIYGPDYCYASSPQDPGAEAEAAAAMIAAYARLPVGRWRTVPDVGAYSVEVLAARYRDCLGRLAGGGPQGLADQRAG